MSEPYQGLLSDADSAFWIGFDCDFKKDPMTAGGKPPGTESDEVVHVTRRFTTIIGMEPTYYRVQWRHHKVKTYSQANIWESARKFARPYLINLQSDTRKHIPANPRYSCTVRHLGRIFSELNKVLPRGRWSRLGRHRTTCPRGRSDRNSSLPEMEKT